MCMLTAISEHMTWCARRVYIYPHLHYLEEWYRNHFMKVLCITTVVIPTLISAQIRRRLSTRRESIGLVSLKTKYDSIELLNQRSIL